MRVHTNAMQRLLVAVTGLLLAAPLVYADDRDQTTSSPGYRRDNENATAFIDSLDSATIAVFPTMIRLESRTDHSFTSQRLAVSLLNDSGLVNAKLANKRVDPGKLQYDSQWNLFQYGLSTVTQSLAGFKTDADFLLVLEFLVPDNQSVFGIECYIIDRQGRDVFSFLLNSHHEMFADAKLHSSGSSENAREDMLKAATEVAIAALKRQVEETDLTGQTEATAVENEPADTSTAPRTRIVIITRLHERLIPVYMHSLKHSIVSGFDSNGVEAKVLFTERDSDNTAQFDAAINEFAPDSVMNIDLDPLLRSRKDGYEAVVGTLFKVTMTDRFSGETTWQMSDKVDYIKIFDRNYVAHPGIRKEFAWLTTETIVSQFMEDIYDSESARIYTVTEDRERHGQRID